MKSKEKNKPDWSVLLFANLAVIIIAIIALIITGDYKCNSCILGVLVGLVSTNIMMVLGYYVLRK